MIFVSTACLKKNSIADIVSILAEHNIVNIELSGGTDYYDEIENDLKRFRSIYGLKYACHAYFPPPKENFVVNLASCNDDIYYNSINHYLNCIDLLNRLDSKILSIHAGFLIEIGTSEIGRKLNHTVIYDKGKSYDRFCSAYEKIKKKSIKNGIELYLENNVLSTENYKAFDYNNYLMMTDYDSIMELKRQIEFNLLLDLGHLHVSDNSLGLDYTKECENIKKYVKWLHISDNNGIIDEHKPLNKNSEIMRMFGKVYSPEINVTLETVGNMEEILDSIKTLDFYIERRNHECRNVDGK